MDAVRNMRELWRIKIRKQLLEDHGSELGITGSALL